MLKVQAMELEQMVHFGQGEKTQHCSKVVVNEFPCQKHTKWELCDYSQISTQTQWPDHKPSQHQESPLLLHPTLCPGLETFVLHIFNASSDILTSAFCVYIFKDG